MSFENNYVISLIFEHDWKMCTDGTWNSHSSLPFHLTLVCNRSFRKVVGLIKEFGRGKTLAIIIRKQAKLMLITDKYFIVE